MRGSDRQNPVYSIGVVQRLTGLSGRQIRYYEEQGLISPHRTKGNQRMYTPSEVDLLKRIKRLLEQGYNIEGVRRALAANPEPTQTPEDNGHEMDHESVVDYLRRPNRLTSLFPISDRSELEKLLRDLSK